MPVAWHGEEYEKHIDGITRKKLDQSGLIVANHIKIVITEKGLIVTGRYRSSIAHSLISQKPVVRIGVDDHYVFAGTNVHYAVYLEFGTEHIPTYAPMRTGLARSKSEVQEVWK
jgi:hypothetical protein